MPVQCSPLISYTPFQALLVTFTQLAQGKWKSYKSSQIGGMHTILKPNITKSMHGCIKANKSIANLKK